MMTGPGRAISISVFELGGYRYGIHLAVTHEFFRLPSITPLPKAPRIVEGIVNIRGKLVPVLDIRQRFHLPEKAPYPTDHLIVAQVGSRLIGLRVDAVLGIQHVDPRDIEDVITIAPGAEYLTGIAKLPDGLVLIHDLRSFLAESEVRDLDAALSDSSVMAS
jgi:purine-binding chemotaxis protein CheW